MLFTYKTTKARHNQKLLQLGYSASHNKYVYIGHDNVFVQRDLKYTTYNTFYNFLYYRNVFPFNRTPTYQNFNYRIYPQSYFENYIAVWSDLHGFKYVLGYELSEETTFAYYDVPNQTIYTKVKTGNFVPANQAEVVMFRNKSLNKHNFVHVFNGMTFQRYIPYYEKLFNPFIKSQNYAYIYDKLKNEGSIEFEVPIQHNITGVPNYRYTFEFPKVIIWFENKYYTYNTSTGFQQITPSNGALITKTDLDNYGIDIDTLNTIEKAEWETIINYNSDCFIITNGYLYPSQIISEWWTDKYDMSQFLWYHIRNQKIVFLMGEL